MSVEYCTLPTFFQLHVRTNVRKILEATYRRLIFQRLNYGPGPVFIAVPYPRTPHAPIGMAIYNLRAIKGRYSPIITFSCSSRRSPLDEFDVFPANEHMINIFGNWTRDVTSPKVHRDSEVQKRLWQQLEWQQLQELSYSPWRLRCKRLPRFCSTIGLHEIVVGKVLEVIPQGREPVNLDSVRWRKIRGPLFSLDEFTSTRFLQRLEALQSKAQIFINTLNQISESLKKPKKSSKPWWISSWGPFRSTKQSRLTEQNQLTNPKRDHDLSETEIVIDINFDAETHRPSSIKSTVLPLRYIPQSADRAGIYRPSNIKSTVLPLRYIPQSADMAGTSNSLNRNTARLRENIEMKHHVASD